MRQFCPSYIQYIFSRTHQPSVLWLCNPFCPLSPAPSINLCSGLNCPSQQHHQPECYNMQTQFNMRSYYFMSMWNGWAIHLAAAVSLPSSAVSAIPSLPSPGAVGALPDATVSLSTPMERSTGREGGREGCTARRQHHTLIWQSLDCSGTCGCSSGEKYSKTFHHNYPIGKTKTSVAKDFGLRSVRLIGSFLSGDYKLQWFSSPFRIVIVEILPHPNNWLFPLSVCSNWGKQNVSVCLCWSLQIGVVTTMTLAEFIMRVSLLLFLDKQACGWRVRNATNEQ